MTFTGTFHYVDFPVKPLNFLVKIGRFSLKNRKIFLKKIVNISWPIAGKADNCFRNILQFFKDNCRFLQEIVTIFTRKSDDFCRICEVSFFVQVMSDLFTFNFLSVLAVYIFLWSKSMLQGYLKDVCPGWQNSQNPP